MTIIFTSATLAQGSNYDNNFFISSDLPTEEIEIMTEIMKELPALDRENVIYFSADGNVYANRSELKNNVETSRYIGDGIYTWENGESFVLPEEKFDYSLSSYACDGTKGPYRRAYSNPGYAYYEGNVYLPSASEVNDQSQPGGNDTAYIYTGGRNVTEVDAGFQYGKTNEDWAFFNRPFGQEHKSGARYRPGQTVTLKFYVSSDGKVTVSTTGIRMGETSPSTQTLVADAPGWKSNGSGNVLKRITSIGQSSNNFNSGSYVKNVKWSNSKIGTTSSNAQQWLAAQTGGYCSFPNSNIVNVNFVNAGEETVSINIPN